MRLLYCLYKSVCVLFRLFVVYLVYLCVMSVCVFSVFVCIRLCIFVARLLCIWCDCL